ncbi:MAG: hypothetical protein KME32_30165 [Mojavia pulchra JT2-VF2]|jgi:hypothetical protein|uniref:Uncharacterized protein n=1 Tax=Mojavia pulchra JT2-VF2 TaxID=287848 RepID=A0A951UJ31_9NOST|nr:hypothetical protein [Mojavia pulchra JT2-VF2]
MNIFVFSPQELPLVLGTLTTVAANPQALTPLEQQFLQVLNQLYQGNVVVDELFPITTAQIAELITNPQQRKLLLQMAMVMAMVDGEIIPSQQKALRSLADTLCVNEQGLRVLHKAASGHKLLARLDIMRRLMGKFINAAYQEEGIVGIKKMVTPFFNGGEDLEVAWKYRQLGLLPEGTLGRAFWEHCTQRHFSFPGEAGGIPERMVFHDFGHILSGYDTNPQGEIQQGAFQAGFIREDGFVFLLFVILHFHWGIQITPIADADVGLFDILLVMQALKRGAACKVDLSDHWNFWEVVNVPVEELRDRYGIPPLCLSAIS